MSRPIVSVIVHLVSRLGRRERTELEETVSAQPGIGRITPSTRSDRLLLVEYDPRATSAQRILEAIQGRGIGARLVGM